MKKVKGIGIGEAGNKIYKPQAGNKIYKPHSKPKVEEHPKQKNLKITKKVLTKEKK